MINTLSLIRGLVATESTTVEVSPLCSAIVQAAGNLMAGMDANQCANYRLATHFLNNLLQTYLKSHPEHNNPQALVSVKENETLIFKMYDFEFRVDPYHQSLYTRHPSLSGSYPSLSRAADKEGRVALTAFAYSKTTNSVNPVFTYAQSRGGDVSELSYKYIKNDQLDRAMKVIEVKKTQAQGEASEHVFEEMFDPSPVVKAFPFKSYL